VKRLALTVRKHARNRGTLDGADAQALEHALTLTELERDTARDQYAFMMQSAADEKLEADREIAERFAELPKRLAAFIARAEIATMRDERDP